MRVVYEKASGEAVTCHDNDACVAVSTGKYSFENPDVQLNVTPAPPPVIPNTEVVLPTPTPEPVVPASVVAEGAV